MTALTLESHRHAAAPRFHVGRPLALLRALAVTVLCLALVLGFLAQVAHGPALRAAAPELARVANAAGAPAGC